MEKRRWSDGLTRYHYLVLTVAAMGWLFDTMDQWLFVFARMPAMKDLLAQAHPGASPAEVGDMAKYYGGIVQAVFLFGWATGGLFFGMVGDRLGRTRTMIVTILIYALFTGLSALSQNWQQFAMFRFLTGLGIGGEFAAGASLVAEAMPEHARTMAMAVLQACSAFGNMMAGAVNLILASVTTDHGAWRWLFVIGAAPAALVFVIGYFLKEPERWTAARDAARSGEIELGSIPHLFREAELRRNTLVGVGLAAVGVIGFWGIGTFSPDLLRSVINPASDPSLARYTEQMVGATGIAQNCGSFFGMLGFAWFAQRIGRRPTFAASFIACTLIVPAVFHLTTSGTIAFITFPVLGLVTSLLFGGYAVYFTELFPTRLRATGTGVCYNVARYLAMAGPFLQGYLSQQFGIRMAATYLSATFLLGLVVLIWAPETKGKPLPE